jgi:hypothetical protein
VSQEEQLDLVRQVGVGPEPLQHARALPRGEVVFIMIVGRALAMRQLCSVRRERRTAVRTAPRRQEVDELCELLSVLRAARERGMSACTQRSEAHTPKSTSAHARTAHGEGSVTVARTDQRGR